MAKPPIKITNQAFLEALAGERWRDVPVSTGDQSWVVYRAEQILGALDSTTANYYTVSTFRPMEDGWLRRVKDHFIGQFAFVLDDVGTKLVEAELWRVIPPPTYILETSPGNKHFGFAVKNGHDARVMAALVYSIIDDPIINPSGRDPGMVGVTRIVRLPVGANCKPAVMEKNGGKPWPHVLHVWEPGRAYSVEELADWLDVDISEPALARYRDGGSHRRATEAEVGIDPLMKLFDQRGMLIDSTPNDNGFVTIRCPWAHEHSDSRDEAGYRPGSGGFQCHHGHCEGKGMKELRAWVEETFTSVERAAALAETFGPVNENDPLLKTIIEKAVVKAEEKRKETVAVVESVLSRYVYIEAQGRFGDLVTTRTIKPEVFNLTKQELADPGTAGKHSATATFHQLGGQSVADMAYEPGKPPVFHARNRGVREALFNLWRPGPVPVWPFGDRVEPEEIATWLDHVNHIFPDAQARRMFFCWAATLVQQPGVKVNWAFVLLGDQGVGKDMCLLPVTKILGKENVRPLKAEKLKDKNQDWAESQLVIVNELPAFHKQDFYDSLKDYSATGQEHFEVNKKYLQPYLISNHQNWFIFSNHRDALALPEDDRRFFIYWSPAKRQEPEYYDRLGAFYEKAENLEKIHRFLVDYDLSAFNPKAPPPETEAKREMQEYARDPVDQVLSAMFEPGGVFHGRKLIMVSEIVSQAQAMRFEKQISEDVLKRMSAGRIGCRLRRLGAYKLPGKFRLPKPESPPSWLWSLSDHEFYQEIAAGGDTAEVRARFQHDSGNRSATDRSEQKGESAEVLPFHKIETGNDDGPF